MVDEARQDPFDELAEIAGDLASLLDWEAATGAFGLPRPAPGAGEALFGPPVDLRRPSPVAPTPAARPAPAAPAPRPLAPIPQPRPSAPPTPTAPRPAPGAQTALPSRWAALAEAPRPAEGLAAIREDLGDCQRCGLCRTRKSIVFGVGNPGARLVIIGEAPGAREDELGEPFVGAAGEMLDRMLQNVLGLTRADVYILNVIKCRPPENRDPTPEEIGHCRPFMERQLQAIAPGVMLTVGRIAAQTLLGTTRGIGGLRGHWHLYQGRIPLMPTFHPAYLLRSPGEKRKTFEDLLLVKEKLASLG